MKFIVLFLPLLTLLSACSLTSNRCETANEIADQINQCQALHQQITLAKNSPIKRTELERRYQKDCVDIRYYRDDKQLAVCGNKDVLKKSL